MELLSTRQISFFILCVTIILDVCSSANLSGEVENGKRSPKKELIFDQENEKEIRAVPEVSTISEKSCISVPCSPIECTSSLCDCVSTPSKQKPCRAAAKQHLQHMNAVTNLEFELRKLEIDNEYLRLTKKSYKDDADNFLLQKNLLTLFLKPSGREDLISSILFDSVSNILTIVENRGLYKFTEENEDGSSETIMDVIKKELNRAMGTNSEEKSQDSTLPDSDDDNEERTTMATE